MHEKGGAFLKTLSAIGRCLPGERFKTAVYLNCIAGPRKVLRQAATGFYRMDHNYDVLREFGDNYAGRFSILEFGVADGYSFTKMLHATKYMGINLHARTRHRLKQQPEGDPVRYRREDSPLP